MKNHSKELLALLCAGCIAFSGCGASDTPEETTDTSSPTEETTEENAENTEAAEYTENTEAAETAANTEATETAANTEATEYAVNTDDSTPAVTEVPAPHETTQTTISSSEKHSVVGIITDATKYSIAIQVPEGDHYYLTIPETGVTGNLDYITIGQLATLTYTGSLDENHASLIDISDSSMITGIYVEEYAFALKIIDACKAMDLEALSDLTNFPVFLETGQYSGPINTSGEFEAIDNEKIFSEALLTRMANFNLFDLQYTDAGFVMGNGTPSITFDVDDDGILGIIGINCNEAPTQSK